LCNLRLDRVGTRVAFLSFLATMILALTACNVEVEDSSPADTSTPTAQASSVDEMSGDVVDEGLETVHVPRQDANGHDLNITHYQGELRLDDEGCIRLGTEDQPVIVWPDAGFDVDIVDDDFVVLDEGSGDEIVRVGDEVVLNGIVLSADLDVHRPHFMAAIDDPLPEPCADKGDYFIMGDHLSKAPSPDVRATPEPPEIDSDEYTVYFPRQAPFGDRDIDDGAPIRELVLDDAGCLRAGEDGPVIIWPYAGYTVDFENGEVALVNEDSGGEIASVGDEISLHGSEPGHGGQVASDVLWHAVPDACNTEAGFYATGPGVNRAEAHEGN
jgi:hypothetical protein